MSEKAPPTENDKTQAVESGEVSSSETSIIPDAKQDKKLVRKLDRHIMPVLVILYLLSFLDRTNIGNARLAGLEADLNMSGLDYNVWPNHPNPATVTQYRMTDTLIRSRWLSYTPSTSRRRSHQIS